MRPLLLALALTAAPAAAQHVHGTAPPVGTDVLEAFVVDGFRIDPAAPPPGSGVGRAGLRFADGGYVHVVYGRPYARGRDVFGGLVGWDDVWVTGAHRATEFVTTVPLEIGGVRVEPGAYSLFTTPRPDRWTVHLNRALGMHLADEYDPALDVVAADVAPSPLAEPVEALTLDFVTADGAGLRVRWGRTSVVLPLRRARP